MMRSCPGVARRSMISPKVRARAMQGVGAICLKQRKYAKSEIRSTKSQTNSKFKIQMTKTRVWCFVLCVCFGFRASDFVLVSGLFPLDQPHFDLLLLPVAEDREHDLVAGFVSG